MPAILPLGECGPTYRSGYSGSGPELLHLVIGRPQICNCSPQLETVNLLNIRNFQNASRRTSYSRLFSIVDYFSTWSRMLPQADRSSIESIGSLPAWMLNPLINMISMLPGGR